MSRPTHTLPPTTTTTHRHPSRPREDALPSNPRSLVSALFRLLASQRLRPFRQAKRRREQTKPNITPRLHTSTTSILLLLLLFIVSLVLALFLLLLTLSALQLQSDTPPPLPRGTRHTARNALKNSDRPGFTFPLYDPQHSLYPPLDKQYDYTSSLGFRFFHRVVGHANPRRSNSHRGHPRRPLQNDFHIPNAILDVLPPTAHHALLRSLRLRASSASSSLPNCPYPPSPANWPRIIFALICGDNLSARLRAVASVLAYASATSRTPVILWKVSSAQMIVAPAVRKFPLAAVIPNDPSSHPYNAHPSVSSSATTTNMHVYIVKVPQAWHLAHDPTDWTQLSLSTIDALTKSKEAIAQSLDRVVFHRHKHIFLRLEDAFISRYAPYAAAVADFEQYLTVTEEPTQIAHQSRPFARSEDATLFSCPYNVSSSFPIEDSTYLMSSFLNGSERSRLPLAASSFFASLFRKRVDHLQTSKADLHRAYLLNFKDRVFPDLTDETVVEILHKEFVMPQIFSAGLTQRGRRQLLHELRSSTSKRALIVHTQFGLGNRLRALGSAMAVARATSRVLIIVWVPDTHLNCTFHDLFLNNDFLVIDNLDLPWPPDKIKAYDDALVHVDFWNMMRRDDGPVHDPLVVNVDPRQGRHLYVKTAYVLRSSFTPRILKTTSPYWNQMRSALVPRIEVQELVHDPSLKNIHNMIGVHIRARTLDKDISGLSPKYYGSGSVTTDHWRKRTGVIAFSTKIRSMPNSYIYYVAADMPESIQALESEFGKHRIFSLRRSDQCDDRNAECLRLALADILLLSRVRMLLGSHWSSFTEAAVRLNDNVKKVLLAGVHFGRPQDNLNRTQRRTQFSRKTSRR